MVVRCGRRTGCSEGRASRPAICKGGDVLSGLSWCRALVQHGLSPDVTCGKDDVAYPTLCKPVIDGVPVERLRIITYAEARHGFDARGLPERADRPGAPAYNAEAA